jgi:hypothetical protein
LSAGSRLLARQGKARQVSGFTGEYPPERARGMGHVEGAATHTESRRSWRGHVGIGVGMAVSDSLDSRIAARLKAI